MLNVGSSIPSQLRTPNSKLIPMSDLTQKRCVPCESGGLKLEMKQILEYLDALADWEVVEDPQAIRRTFTFRNFHETMAFVNALAWIAHTEDHHPDFKVGYKTCEVTYTTHSMGGLSENDFICAAKISALL